MSAQRRMLLDTVLQRLWYASGPSAYNASGGLGRQQLSERETLPQWRMGTERRFASAGARQCAAVPGPGQAKYMSLPVFMHRSCICMYESRPLADLPSAADTCLAAVQRRAMREPTSRAVHAQGHRHAAMHAYEGAHGSELSGGMLPRSTRRRARWARSSCPPRSRRRRSASAAPTATAPRRCASRLESWH